MVQVKLNRSIVSIHGRHGGNYFKRGVDGTHLQAMPRNVYNVRAGPQMAGVSNYSGMAAIWHLALLTFFWAAWHAFALVNLFTDDDGRSKKITGYNWYIHYWILFPEEERLPFWQPPRKRGDLPSYIVTWQGLTMYRKTPDVWPAHCSAGYYYPGLEWNGAPSYRTDDMHWFLWWTGVSWCLSLGLDFEDPATTYYSDGIEINDWYRNAANNSWAHVYVGCRPGLKF